jgi:hypothetical protein
VSAPAAEALSALLTAYADPAPGQAMRLVDVPPDVARRALRHLPPDLAAARLNLVRPPMTWLVEQADRLGARLVGSLTADRGLAAFDGLQVEVASARTLAERTAAAWPATGDIPGALQAAVAEAWPSWTAEWPSPSHPEAKGLWRGWAKRRPTEGLVHGVEHLMADQDLSAAQRPEERDGSHDSGEVLALLGILDPRRLGVVRPGQRKGDASSGRFSQRVEHFRVARLPRHAFHDAGKQYPYPTGPSTPKGDWCEGGQGARREARSAQGETLEPGVPLSLEVALFRAVRDATLKLSWRVEPGPVNDG